MYGIGFHQGSFEEVKRLWGGILPRFFSGRAQRNRRIESCALCDNDADEEDEIGDSEALLRSADRIDDASN